MAYERAKCLTDLLHCDLYSTEFDSHNERFIFTAQVSGLKRCKATPLVKKT